MFKIYFLRVLLLYVSFVAAFNTHSLIGHIRTCSSYGLAESSTFTTAWCTAHGPKIWYPTSSIGSIKFTQLGPILAAWFYGKSHRNSNFSPLPRTWNCHQFTNSPPLKALPSPPAKRGARSHFHRHLALQKSSNISKTSTMLEVLSFTISFFILWISLDIITSSSFFDIRIFSTTSMSAMWRGWYRRAIAVHSRVTGIGGHGTRKHEKQW